MRCWPAISAALANRVYPVGYEWGRMARVGAVGFVGYATAVLLVPAAGPRCPRWRPESSWPASAYVGLLVLTGFLTASERGVSWSLGVGPQAADRADAGRRRWKPRCRETTELAGNVVSATAGEIIEASDEVVGAPGSVDDRESP